MESNLQEPPKLGYLGESSDANYVSGLSTILVATIQEAKDRISQIEYIFCTQLYPKFQSTLRNLQEKHAEARKAAEDAFNEKEKDMLLQINNLQCQKQQFWEENQSLKLEKEKYINMESRSCNFLKELEKELRHKTIETNESKELYQNLQRRLESKLSLTQSYEKTIEELEGKNTMLLSMEKKLEVENEELRHELIKKSKQADEVMELQNKLLETNQSKASLIAQKELQLKEYEEKTNRLASKLASMENKVNDLISVVKVKTEEVDKGKELQGNLLKKIEFQSSEIMNNEQLLTKFENENRLLAAKVGSLVNRGDELQKELKRRTSELDEVRKVQEQSLQQSDVLNFERAKEQILEEFGEERKQLLDKQKGLEEKVDKLQQRLFERTEESSEGMKLHGKLLQQIEAKDSELLSEKRKRRDAFAAYKKLKSQYKFLLDKYGLNQETMLPLDKIEEESGIIRHSQTSATPRDIGNNPVTKPVDDQEVLKDKKDVFIERSVPISPSSASILVAPKCPSSVRSCPPAGAKRPISYWRDTRSHQSRAGPDPHDDFLDTPLENVRENLGKVMKEDKDIPDFPKPGPIIMSLDNSDDQTQDMDANAGAQKLMSPPKAGPSGFKYVEPVRKKSERESLKGVECKQCKKFYDAVLPDAGNSDKQNMRCEHHDGVSRHRYRYAPPSTPEGFWNIGFESEMYE